MYVCKYFKIHELVPPEIYRLRGEKAWELFDDRLLITADKLRGRYGRMTVNNWYWGGDRMWSGLRTPDSPYYSKTSQHSLGNAIDALFAHVPANQVQYDILADPNNEDFKLIQSIELNVSWLHFDTRNCHRIETFYKS